MFDYDLCLILLNVLRSNLQKANIFLKKMPSTAMQKLNTSMTDKNTPLYFATDLEAQNNIGFVPATTQNEKLNWRKRCTLMFGLKWLCHLSLHCFPTLPGSICAM